MFEYIKWEYNKNSSNTPKTTNSHKILHLVALLLHLHQSCPFLVKSQSAPALTTLLSQTGSRNCYADPDRCGVEATFGSWGLCLLPDELWLQPVLWKQADFYAKESCKSKPFDITCCACVLIHVNLYAWLESGCNKPSTLEIYSSFSPLWVLTFRMQDDIQLNKKNRSPFQQTRTKLNNESYCSTHIGQNELNYKHESDLFWEIRKLEKPPSL